MNESLPYLCFQIVNSTLPVQAFVGELDELLTLRYDINYSCTLNFNVTCDPLTLTQVGTLPVWGNASCVTTTLDPPKRPWLPDWWAAEQQKSLAIILVMTSVFWVPLGLLAIVGLCALASAMALPFIWLWNQIEDSLACFLGWIFCFPCKLSNRKDPLQPPTQFKSSDSSITLT